MRFATRLLLMQLATVTAVVAVCALVFGWLGVRQLRAESEAAALNIARTVAEDPDVKSLVAEFSADPGTPDAAQLRTGELQQIAADVADRTDALFVVITDDHGIRLAHPTEELLGQVVLDALRRGARGQRGRRLGGGNARRVRSRQGAGLPGGRRRARRRGECRLRARERVRRPSRTRRDDRDRGGRRAGARRRSPRCCFDDGSSGSPSGSSRRSSWPSCRTRRRCSEGVGDGVVALDPDGVVRVCNEAAERMLGIDAPVGRRFDELALPDTVRRRRAGRGVGRRGRRRRPGAVPRHAAGAAGRTGAGSGRGRRGTAPTSRRSPAGSRPCAP